MEKQYAQALWKMVHDGMKPTLAVKQLFALLERRGHSAISGRVARAFKKTAAEEARRHGTTLVAAKQSHAARAAKEAKVRLNEVSLEVDESLIGGWQLVGGGEITDNSYKKKLLDIYKHVTA